MVELTSTNLLWHNAHFSTIGHIAMQMTINNIITIKDFLFNRPAVIRDNSRLLFKSDYIKKEEEQNIYFIEIVKGIYTDDELINICEPNNKKGGRIYKQQNGVTQIIIYK